MITTRSKLEIEHLIKGPAGLLEVLTMEPTKSSQPVWGIVCHPHPLHGGSMSNKVVTTLAKTFQAAGAIPIRFNFRGVGQSQGEFDHGLGEADDLLAVINWALDERPDHEIWLAGFSFGAYIAAKVATKIPLGKLVLVAPPVTDFAMDSMGAFTASWILVQGDADEVISPAAVYSWAQKCKPEPLILRFPSATHFFHGQLVELRERVGEALAKI